MLLDTEQIFYTDLIAYLPDRYQIIKSSYKYCVVDFMVINTSLLKFIYVEHKRRYFNKDAFNTIWIKVSKVKNILSRYGKFIFVNTLNNDIIFILIDESTIDKYEQTTNEYNELVLNISTSDFISGYDDLTAYIIHKI